MIDTPRIALGTWAWGNDTKIFGETYTLDQLREVYRTALSAGLCLFDTAPAYGDGKCEENIGALIADTDRDRIIISTKFTPRMEDGTDKAMEHMVHDSLRRLGTDFIDVYWIHAPSDIERYTPMLIPLYKEGLIRKIGVSNHDLGEVRRVEEILGKENVPLGAVQNHYSILNRSSEDSGIIRHCLDNGMDFYAFMVLEQGALLGKYSSKHPFEEGTARAKAYNSKLDKLDIMVSILSRIASEKNASIANILTAWALSKGVMPLIGATKPAHVMNTAASLDIELSIDEIKELEKAADELDLSTVRGFEKVMR